MTLSTQLSDSLVRQDEFDCNFIKLEESSQNLRQILINRYCELMLSAKAKIVTVFRNYQLRKWMLMGMTKVKIYWERKDSSNLKRSQLQKDETKDQVQIIGDFTNPAWNVKIDMVYDDKLKAYSKQLLIPHSSQFHFIVNGYYTVSSYYPTVKNGQFTNNQFFKIKAGILPQPKTTSIIQSVNVLEPQSELSNFTEMNHPDDFKQVPEKKTSPKKKLIINQNNKRFSSKVKRPKVCQENQQPNEYSKAGVSLKVQRLKLEIQSQSDQLNVSSCYSDISFEINPAQDRDHFFIGSAFQISKGIKQPCEDSYFICENAVGVSDGVGGWINYGIDSSQFSKQLMNECKAIIRGQNKSQFHIMNNDQIRAQQFECHQQALLTQISYQSSFESLNSECSWESVSISLTAHDPIQIQSYQDPQTILRKAFKRTTNIGGGTALLAVLNNDTLHASNLGDSGFILIRFDQITGSPYIVLRSKEQQHSFNTPFQLTRLPNQYQLAAIKKRVQPTQYQKLVNVLQQGKFIQDSPEDADNYQVHVKDGDILIIGSDGIFDNLYDEEILEVVSYGNSSYQYQRRHNERSRMISQQLVELAQEKSTKSNIKTPFNEKKADTLIQNKEYLLANYLDPNLKQILKSVMPQGFNSFLDIERFLSLEKEQLSLGKGKVDDITAVCLYIKAN